MFAELENEQIHTYHTDSDEDEHDKDKTTPYPPKIMECHIGNSELMKNFNQNCVTHFESPSVYVFHLFGL